MSEDLQKLLDEAIEHVDEIKRKIRQERLENITNRLEELVEFDNDNDEDIFEHRQYVEEIVRQITCLINDNCYGYSIKAKPYDYIICKNKEYSLINTYMVEIVDETYYLCDVVTLFRAESIQLNFFNDINPLSINNILEQIEKILNIY